MTARRGLRGLAAVVASSALLAGCGSLSALNPTTWFSSKPKPAELENITPKINGRLAWSARVDSIQFPLIASVNGDTLTVAGTDGSVMALNAADGRELWRGNAGGRIAAGVGSDGRYAAVVTRDNDLVVLQAGAIKWQTRLGSRVVTPPLVAGERVFVMGVDRAVRAYDEVDGRFLWVMQRPGDALTLAEPGLLAPFKDTLLVGQGPRLVGLDPLNGNARWELPMANPRGTNEVERLADLVGPALRLADVVCARAFQSAVTCANAERGTTVWTKNIGGIDAIGGDEQLVFGADASDRITAWKAGNGDVAWTNERFLNRELSAPAVVGPAVAFGDLQGYVHFLSRETGETLLRLPTDGSPVAGVPLRVGKLLVVATRNGGLYAFSLE